MIEYTLPAAGEVSLRVYDTMGRCVATLVEGRQERGMYSVPFRVRQIPSGIYTVVLRAGGAQSCRSIQVW